MGLSDINLLAQIAAALAAVGAAGKSAYNGTIDRYIFERLRKAEEAHERTQEIEAKVDEIQDHQKTQTDALIQIGEMTSEMNGHDFNADLLRKEVDREEADRFIERRPTEDD